MMCLILLAAAEDQIRLSCQSITVKEEAMKTNASHNFTGLHTSLFSCFVVNKSQTAQISLFFFFFLKNWSTDLLNLVPEVEKGVMLSASVDIRRLLIVSV